MSLDEIRQVYNFFKSISITIGIKEPEQSLVRMRFSRYVSVYFIAGC